MTSYRERLVDDELRRLRTENEKLHKRVRELEAQRDAIQADSNRALEAYRAATMVDDAPIATTNAAPPAIPGYMNRTAPFHTPRPTVAGEVLPPDQRASWARGKTDHDK